MLLIQNDLVIDLDPLYLLLSYGKISKVNDKKQVFLTFIYCFNTKNKIFTAVWWSRSRYFKADDRAGSCQNSQSGPRFSNTILKQKNITILLLNVKCSLNELTYHKHPFIQCC